MSRTYKRTDGFAPIFGYIGRKGYLSNLELREGKQHCQKNTPEFLNHSEIKSDMDIERLLSENFTTNELITIYGSRDVGKTAANYCNNRSK